MTRWTSAALVALAATLGASALGCKDDSRRAENDRYRVRGVVIELAGEGQDARVTIQHESIANFKDRQGRPGEMPSMKMAFGLSQGVDRSVLVTGRKVEVVFDVDWQREPALRIEEITPLPADTPLTL